MLLENFWMPLLALSQMGLCVVRRTVSCCFSTGLFLSFKICTRPLSSARFAPLRKPQREQGAVDTALVAEGTGPWPVPGPPPRVMGVSAWG